jgi:hypothetical protein
VADRNGDDVNDRGTSRSLGGRNDRSIGKGTGQGIG